MVDSLNLYLTQYVDEKVSGGKVDETGNRLVQFEAKANHSVEGQNLSASEDLQNALVLLYRKRQEQVKLLVIIIHGKHFLQTFLLLHCKIGQFKHILGMLNDVILPVTTVRS